MSDDLDGVAPDDPDALAGEYVLGVLEGSELDAARRRIDSDPAFARLVMVWEQLLYPLVALIAAVAPPPELWARIEDSTAGGAQAARAVPPAPPPSNDNNVGFWRVTALASMAIAAGLAAFIALRPLPRPIIAEALISRPVVAVLQPSAGGAAVLVAVADPTGALQVRPSGAITVPDGRDLQLWSLPAGATKPASLGVLPVTGKQVPARLALGTQIMVSLEPKGGSPTGQPTGPVLYAGKLAAFE